MRYAVAIVSGSVVSVLLFLLMHTLIAGDPTLQRDDQDRANLEFVRVKEDEITQKRERRKPPEPEKAEGTTSAAEARAAEQRQAAAADAEHPDAKCQRCHCDR